MATRQQFFAQAAYVRVDGRKSLARERKDEYVSFCKSFPAMIHSCGLCQAVTFAAAKGHRDYLQDLETVLNIQNIEQRALSAGLPAYKQLSRDATLAASWLKRYVEALL